MKKDIFSKSLYVSFCLIFLSLFILPLPHSMAEDYPIRPISIIVPFAPGGVTDISARACASVAEKHLGQPVVVLNKPGGRSLIGGNAVATAKPDGYTIGLLQLHPTIPEAYVFFQETPYTSKDLKPIAQLVIPPVTITVKAEAPWNSLAELIAYARKNPGFKYGGHGEGSLGHLMMINITKAEGILMKHVPFDGDSQILAAILGGHIPMGTPTFPSLKPQLDAGNVKLLAMVLEDRLETVPKVPTVTELGYRLPFVPYLGFFAPKGTSDSIIKKLDAVTKQVAEDESFVTKMRNIGIQVRYQNAEKFKESIAKYKTNIETLFKELGYLK